MKFVSKFLIIALVVIVCFELFSFAASKAGLLLVNSPPQYKVATWGDDWRNEKHPWGAWHKVKLSDQHTRSCFDVTYQSNDVGARDKHDYLGLKDTDNVAVIGDSFVEGVGVALEKTFTHQLKKKYGKRGLNFGTSGNFGPVQQYLIHKKLIKELPHDEVVYFFMPSNDFVDNSDRYMKLFGSRYRPYFSKKNGDETYEIIYPPNAVPSETFPSGDATGASPQGITRALKKVLIGYTWSANTLRTIVHLDRYIRYMPSNKNLQSNTGYFFDDDYSVNGAIHFVEKMFSGVPAHYKKTIVVIPRKFDLKQIVDRGWDYQKLRWYTRLQSVAQDFNAEFIDLALNDHDEKSIDYVKRGMDTWFLTCDWHWSNAGHEMVLRRFLDATGKSRM